MTLQSNYNLFAEIKHEKMYQSQFDLNHSTTASALSDSINSSNMPNYDPTCVSNMQSMSMTKNDGDSVHERMKLKKKLQRNRTSF